jgi:hypothetical protein
MDYGDILIFIEQIVEAIEYEEINIAEVKSKLEDLASDIEDTIETPGDEFEDFGFDDLD